MHLLCVRFINVITRHLRTLCTFLRDDCAYFGDAQFVCAGQRCESVVFVLNGHMDIHKK